MGGFFFINLLLNLSQNEILKDRRARMKLCGASIPERQQLSENWV